MFPAKPHFEKVQVLTYSIRLKLYEFFFPFVDTPNSPTYLSLRILLFNVDQENSYVFII